MPAGAQGKAIQNVLLTSMRPTRRFNNRGETACDYFANETINRAILRKANCYDS